MRLRLSGLLLLVFVLTLVTLSFADSEASDSASATEIPSDEEISKMKIGALKSFLQARGVRCSGCSERTDYVKEALTAKALPTLTTLNTNTNTDTNTNDNKEKEKEKAKEKAREKAKEEKKEKEKEKAKAKAEKEAAKAKAKESKGKDKDKDKDKRKEADKGKDKSKTQSKGTLASTWQLRAIRMCHTLAKTKKLAVAANDNDNTENDNVKTFCSRVGKVLASKFSSMSTGLFSALGKSADKTLKTSLSEPFKSAGETALRNWLNDCFAVLDADGGLASLAQIDDEKFNEAFSKSQLSKWLLDTMMDKRESMFGGDDLENMIRKMKLNEGGAPPPPPKKAPARAEEDYEDHLEL